MKNPGQHGRWNGVAEQPTSPRSGVYRVRGRQARSGPVREKILWRKAPVRPCPERLTRSRGWCSRPACPDNAGGEGLPGGRAGRVPVQRQDGGGYRHTCKSSGGSLRLVPSGARWRPTPRAAGSAACHGKTRDGKTPRRSVRQRRRTAAEPRLPHHPSLFFRYDHLLRRGIFGEPPPGSSDHISRGASTIMYRSA